MESENRESGRASAHLRYSRATAISGSSAPSADGGASSTCSTTWGASAGATRGRLMTLDLAGVPRREPPAGVRGAVSLRAGAVRRMAGVGRCRLRGSVRSRMCRAARAAARETTLCRRDVLLDCRSKTPVLCRCCAPIHGTLAIHCGASLRHWSSWSATPHGRGLGDRLIGRASSRGVSRPRYRFRSGRRRDAVCRTAVPAHLHTCTPAHLVSGMFQGPPGRRVCALQVARASRQPGYRYDFVVSRT